MVPGTEIRSLGGFGGYSPLPCFCPLCSLFTELRLVLGELAAQDVGEVVAVELVVELLFLHGVVVEKV